MQARFSYLSVLCVMLFITASCSNSTDKGNNTDTSSQADTSDRSLSQNYFSEVFLPEKKMAFREVSLDMDLKSVKIKETDNGFNLSGETDNYLHYEKDLNIDTTKGVDYVEVKYIFDDLDRLDIITINYYIQDSLITDDLFNHLNTSLSNRYGDYYIDSDGYTVWESSYKRSDTIDVVFDIGIRKLVKLNDPGITIEMMRFGAL